MLIISCNFCPTTVHDKLDAAEIRKSALIANIHRKDLSHMEKVKGVAAYYESGISVSTGTSFDVPERFLHLYRSLAHRSRVFTKSSRTSADLYYWSNSIRL